MTFLSRIGVSPAPREGERRRYSKIATPWHVLCIPLWSSGCFYFLPLQEVQENVPPIIKYSSPEEGEPLVLDLAVTKVFVVVEEPDGDSFTCLWYIDGGVGEVGPSEPIQGAGGKGCQVSLTPDPDYHGRTLTCTVFDEPDLDSTERSWPIEVIGEGT